MLTSTSFKTKVLRDVFGSILCALPNGIDLELYNVELNYYLQPFVGNNNTTAIFMGSYKIFAIKAVGH